MEDIDRLRRYQKLGLISPGAVETIEHPPAEVRERLARQRSRAEPRTYTREGWEERSREIAEERLPREIELTEAELADLERQREDIEPAGIYYTDESRDRMMRGLEVRSRILDPAIERKREHLDYLRRSHPEWQRTHEESKRFHPGVTAVKTDQGYKIKPPAPGVLEKERFYARPGGEQHMAQVAAPTMQFIAGLASLVHIVTGGAVKIAPEQYDPYTGERIIHMAGAPEKEYRTTAPGSLFGTVAPIAPTLYDVVPWAPKWRQEWVGQRVKESPLSLVTMGAGEGALFAGFNLGLRAAGGVIKSGIKIVVKKAPPVIGKIESVAGRGSVVLESGAKIPSVSSRVGETAFWHHLKGWSRGTLVRSRVLPLKKTIPFYSKSGAHVLKSKLRIYKGWGRISWEPKGVISQALRADSAHIHKYIFRGRYQSFMREAVYPAKGRLWYKTFKKQVTTFSEHKPLVSITERANLWGGWVREPVLKSPYGAVAGKFKPAGGLWRDITAAQRLVPGVSRSAFRGGLHHAGYLSGEITIPSASFASSLTTASAVISIAGTRAASMLQFKQVPKLDIMFKQKFDVGRISVPSLESARISALSMEQAQLTAGAQLGVQAQVFQQKQLQAQLLDTRLDMRFEQISTHLGGRTSTPHIGVPHTPIIPIIPLLDGVGRAQPRADSGQAFAVYVKDRSYVGGRKRYSERFTRMKAPPLNESNSLALGAHLVDNSAAVTFFVKPISGKPQQPKHRVAPWSFMRGKFYPSKGRYVEHTAHRIDSSGELAQITAKGLLSRMNKRAKAPVSRAYSMESIFDKKAMRKMFRGIV